MKKSLDFWEIRLFIVTLHTIINYTLLIMGTHTKDFAEIQTKRAAYQLQKTKEYMNYLASLLTEEDKKILFSGEGFVEVPKEEFQRNRISSYPCLIP